MGFQNLGSKLLLNTQKYLPYARHYNPLSIWNRSWLQTADFEAKKSFLVIQTALQYKPRLIWPIFSFLILFVGDFYF